MGSGSLNFSCSEFGLLLGSILLLDFLIDIDTERCFAYRILSAYSQIYLKSADSAESAEFSYIVVTCLLVGLGNQSWIIRTKGSCQKHP